MKIHNISNYTGYNGCSKPAKREEAISNKKYDVIEINKNKAIKDKNSVKLDTIKKDISLQVNKEIGSEKLESIRESINKNTYQINADDIVKKLLDE